MSSNRIRILHLISTTNVGGAERNLQRLVCGMDRSRFDNLVVSMTTIGPVGMEFEKSGIPVKALNMAKGLPDPRGIFKLARIVHEYQPDIIQCWMYHANVLGLLFGRKRAVIWNIRCSDMDLNKYGPIYRWTVKTGSLLSSFPATVIANSYAGREWHKKLGYHPEKWEVIPNGIDTDIFKPAPASRKKIRTELGIPDSAPVIGMIARFDPMKDHQTFFKAASQLQKSHADVHFILAGRGINNPTILNYLAEMPLPDKFHLLGERQDIPQINAALDIATLSSSYGEGFPNVLAEAMACGIPCVATNVGDSNELIGDTGLTLPPGNPESIAKAWCSLLENKDRVKLSRQTRARIIKNYSLDVMIKHYQELYENILD